MGDDIVLTRPGKPDINDQFTAGKNIRRTRLLYDRINKNGDYRLGDLTAIFYGFDEDQEDRWQDDIKVHYLDKWIKKIKDNVVKVLSKVNDRKSPISLKFEWDESAPKGVVMTSDAAGHAYTMKISGMKKPSGTSLNTRSKTKSD